MKQEGNRDEIRRKMMTWFVCEKKAQENKTFTQNSDA